MSDPAFNQLFHWTYAGVNNTLVGNGGTSCAEFIPTFQKVVETILFSSIGIFEICYAWPRLALPSKLPTTRSDDNGSRNLLLAIMCLTFGVEIGFKLASQQLIWILNPCHLITMIQIYLLVAPPSRTVTALFRIQMHCLNGATIAILFPIVNTRLLPFETQTYYLQHFLMLVVPFYLMRTGGPYIPEPIENYTWVILTLGLLFVYHWIPLQFLALMSLVNLNNMMCPAVSDPFYSRWYRIGAATHQTALILVHGKLYTYISSLLLSTHKTIDDRLFFDGKITTSSQSSSFSSSSSSEKKQNNVVIRQNGFSKMQ